MPNGNEPVLPNPLTFDCRIGRLREWQRGDENALVEIADNPNVASYMADGFPSPYTKNDAVAWVELNESASEKTHFAIVVDDRIVGGIGFAPLTAERRLVADIGYWLGEAYWGRGIGTAACEALTAYAFEQFGLRRLQAAVYVPNVASRRVLEKCGYQVEGLLRNAVIKRGVLLDAHLCAKVR